MPRGFWSAAAAATSPSCSPRGPRTGTLHAQRPPASPHARHRHAVPHGRSLRGHAAAEAQAMGRPVVATTVGVLPENLLCPPRMRDDLRTGWLVRPGNVGELARAVASVLALDVTAYAALSARARQFAEFAFSPQSVAEAIRGVYTSLLARDV